MPGHNLTSNRQIGIILLAAGAATRFGRDKLREKIGHQSLIAWSIQAAVASGLTQVVVVVRPGQSIPSPRVSIAVNPHPEEGLSSSVRCGLDIAAQQDWQAAILTPADQPLLSPFVYLRLANAFHDGAEIAIAAYHGRPRNPVLVAKSRWPDSMKLSGDTGLAAIARSPEAALIECGDIASIDDVDTPSDLATIESRLPRPRIMSPILFDSGG